jgi:predicted GTPase
MRVQDPVEEERSREVALALLEAAMEPPDEDEEEPGEVREEDQMSLSVGIVGAPNAGKSSLTNTVVRVISALALCVPWMFQ